MFNVSSLKFILICLFISLSFWLKAQITIAGVVSEKSGEPLLGVNVYLKGTYDGATTSIDGSFSFISHQKDSLNLVVSFVGFHELTLPLSNKDHYLTIVLKEKIGELNTVVITAGSFNASDENKREVLKPLDIVTTAGSSADIPGALNTLPGTQAVGETGRLFVRGGDGRETKTFIDGMLVHNEYSPSAPNTPGRSRFSPFMFKGMSFSTGGYSAEYGQALSSALILQSKDLADNDRVDISLMTVGADISATRSFNNSSLAGKVHYTNLTPYFHLAPQNLNWDKAPEEVNGNFAYRLKTSKTGLLKFYANLSTSNMELFESDIANPEIQRPVNVSNDYAHFNASYRELVNEKWGLRGGISITKSKDYAARDQSSIEQKLHAGHAKLVFDHQFSDRISMIFGGEVFIRTVEQALGDRVGFLDQDLTETINASFIESEIFLSSAFAFKLGGRMEFNSLNHETTFSPRFSAAYKTGQNSQVSLAYGEFHQNPNTQILLAKPNTQSEQARHFIANYQWIKDGRSFRAELYEKRYDDLVQYQNRFDQSSFRSNGDGFARGLDFFWRDNRTFKNMDYWISYSLLQTERNYQDYPGSFTPSFASTHNFSVVTKKFIEEIRSQVGLTYSFASPRTYTDRNSERFLSGKTPAYHDLSINFSYLYSNQVIIHAMVNNVLGVNNIFGYEFSEQPDTNGVYASRPITPPAKRFIFLGVFITLSKNKGINQLPNL